MKSLWAKRHSPEGPKIFRLEFLCGCFKGLKCYKLSFFSDEVSIVFKGPCPVQKGLWGGKQAWHLDGTIDGGNVGGIWRKEKERKHV